MSASRFIFTNSNFFLFFLYRSLFHSVFRSVLSEAYRRKVETCTLHTHENDNDFLFDNFSPLDHLNAFAFENEREKKMNGKWSTELKHEKKEKKQNIYIQSEAKKKSTCKYTRIKSSDQKLAGEKISIISISGTPKKALKYGQTLKMNKCKM